ncbi:MAG: hypothetical protein EPN23_06510 [Verrucomicrobia bacterium]|nr:MAG: hypothetical protein EPN23_06510 [Verrucomicrobiota bacterium]
MWWTAFFLLLLGGLISAAIYAYRSYDLEWHEHLALSIMVTVIAVGITIICATAHRWMHR